MRGIAGIVNLGHQKPISPYSLKRIIANQQYHEPDETGAFLDDNIGLTHTRISIIDFKDGTQPIYNEDKSLRIIYNGEVFNYPELRQEPIRYRHKFYNTSNSELMLHLYEEKRIDSLNNLNSQFAFAIWDSINVTLLLSQDRVGILRLHFAVQNRRLYFASEIKSIFTNNEIDKSLDYDFLDQIFTYWTTLPGKTVFNNIKELPPTHYVLISPQEIKTGKYWDFNFPNNNETVNRKTDDLVNEISETFMDSVRIRLRAEVPVGTYLSGGIDSSAITETDKKNLNNDLRSFGSRFENKDYDEGRFHNERVDFLKVNHSEIIASNNSIGAYLEVNESGYKVLLTGDCADEIFSSYNIYNETKIRNFWAKDPDTKLRSLRLVRMYPYIFKDDWFKQTLISLSKNIFDNSKDPFFSHNIRWKNSEKIKNFCSERIIDSTRNYSSYSELIKLSSANYFEWDTVTKSELLESLIFLSNYLLPSHEDRVAMAHSLELRMPNLSYRLIDLLAKVKSEIKISGLNEKSLLKQVFKNRIPDNILNRWKNPYKAPINKVLLSNYINLSEDHRSEKVLKSIRIFHSLKV